MPFVLSVATIVIFLATNVVKAHAKKVQTGSASLIGKIGIAQTAITDVGQIFLEGEIWTAINQSPQPIQKGEKIKVVGVDKVKLLVLKA